MGRDLWHEIKSVQLSVFRLRLRNFTYIAQERVNFLCSDLSLFLTCPILHVSLQLVSSYTTRSIKISRLAGVRYSGWNL
jgi:hypothetical protein